MSKTLLELLRHRMVRRPRRLRTSIPQLVKTSQMMRMAVRKRVRVVLERKAVHGRKVALGKAKAVPENVASPGERVVLENVAILGGGVVLGREAAPEKGGVDRGGEAHLASAAVDLGSAAVHGGAVALGDVAAAVLDVVGLGRLVVCERR